MGGHHGTTGLDKGLFGALIIRKATDLKPDRAPFVVVMKDDTINLKKAPNTPIFKANEGDRIEFVVITHGDLFHTFHLHGHRWFDTRTGYAPAGVEEQAIDNRTTGPADSFGFQVIAGQGVGPGAWMYHCHVQGHSDGGMTGFLQVNTPGGLSSQQTQSAIREWRRSMSAGGGHHHG
jgi:FtsP/CotA-like multicopper oxidase with cupredoxin domain